MINLNLQTEVNIRVNIGEKKPIENLSESLKRVKKITNLISGKKGSRPIVFVCSEIEFIIQKSKITK